MTMRVGRSVVGTVHETDLATDADGSPAPGAEGGRVLRALVVDDSAPVRDLVDGFGTLARLRADEGTASIPVVLVTGRALAADRARGEALGADAYLTKPFEPAELVAVVRHLARHGRRYA